MVGCLENKRVDSKESIVSQNVRGIKSEARLKKTFLYILLFGVFPVCLQEIWGCSTKLLENSNCLLFLSGLDKEQQIQRGSPGIKVSVSP